MAANLAVWSFLLPLLLMSGTVFGFGVVFAGTDGTATAAGVAGLRSYHHNQDLDDKISVYSSASVVNVIDVVKQQAYTYRGRDEIRVLFAALFANWSDPGAVVVQAADESEGMSFVIWEARTQGFMHVSETIQFDPDFKISWHDIAVNHTNLDFDLAGNPAEESPVYDSDYTYDDDYEYIFDFEGYVPVNPSDVMTNHANAFWYRDVKRIKLGFDQNTTIKLWNYAQPGRMKVYQGLRELEEYFTNTFQIMDDMSSLGGTPTLHAQEDHQFMLWENTAYGAVAVSETIEVGRNLKIRVVNLAGWFSYIEP